MLPAFLCDVEVTTGPTPERLERPAASGVLWQASAGKFLIDVPDVARYFVSDGDSVRIELKANASPERVARFLRLAPLAALLNQRGLMACSAAAVAMPEGGAILIAGVSASGKSTMAAALVARGCRLLADEIVPIELDGQPRVRPVAQNITLFPDAVAHLFPCGAPAWVSAGGETVEGIFPLRKLVHLTIDPPAGNGDNQMSVFQLVSQLTWNARIAEVLLDPTQALRISAAVARSVSVRRFVRSGLSQVAEQVAQFL